MQNLLVIIFAINLSLLFVHEMEAIRHQEWKMFIVLKDMEEKKAYTLFLLMHIPLYSLILWILLSPNVTIGFFITDVFLVIHLLIHLLFMKHKNNRFNNPLSLCIIILMGVLSALHLIGMLFITNGGA